MSKPLKAKLDKLKPFLPKMKKMKLRDWFMIIFTLTITYIVLLPMGRVMGEIAVLCVMIMYIITRHRQPSEASDKTRDIQYQVWADNKK